MKKSMSVLSLFAAGAMILGGAGLGHADDLKVSGFGTINFNLTDEASDNSCQDTSNTANSTNCTELQFSVPSVEVDFEKTVGSVTVRLDLDFNVKNGVNIGNDDVEQLRFDWTLPVGQELGLTLTGGIFNSPVGFEAQDSPDKLQISNGQLFGMVPSNLAGLQLSGGTDMVSGSLLFVNDWRDFGNATVAPATQALGEENTIGFTLAVSPMPEAGLSIGYLSSGLKPLEDTLDIILSGTVMPSPDLELLYAIEFVSNETQDGTGITLHAKHGKHGATIRYDKVETDGLSVEPTTLTIAFLCSLEENLKVKLEWKQTDEDVPNAQSNNGVSADNDAVTLQFVAMF